MSDEKTVDKELLLVDGSNLFARAYHTSGQDVTATVPKVRAMLARYVRKWKPTHVVVALDCPGPSFRAARIAEYKADREGPKRTPIPTLTQAMLPPLESWGVVTAGLAEYEADDVIATLAERGAGKLQVTILSKDSDMLQLVDDTKRIRVLWPEQGDELVIDEAQVRVIAGLRPDQLVDYRILVGGKDNLPRVGDAREEWDALKAAGERAPFGFTELRAREVLTVAGSIGQLYGRFWNSLERREQRWLLGCHEKIVELLDALPLVRDVALQLDEERVRASDARNLKLETR